MVNQRIAIPIEKISKALEMIETFLNKKNHKVTMHQVQRLCGTLNFLCRAIIPGCMFTRRLSAVTAGAAGKSLKFHHHVRLNMENLLDLQVWKKFLLYQDVFCRPFMDMCITTADELDMYSDVAKSWCRGVGAYCKNEWVAAK